MPHPSQKTRRSFLGLLAVLPLAAASLVAQAPAPEATPTRIVAFALVPAATDTDAGSIVRLKLPFVCANASTTKTINRNARGQKSTKWDIDRPGDRRENFTCLAQKKSVPPPYGFRTVSKREYGQPPHSPP